MYRYFHSLTRDKCPAGLFLTLRNPERNGEEETGIWRRRRDRN